MQYTIYKELNLIVYKMGSEHSFEDVLESVTRSFSDPDFEHKLNAICDFTNVSNITGSLEALFKLSDTMKDKDIVSVPSNTAIIVQDLDNKLYGLVESYQMMAADSLAQTKIFTVDNYQQALDFVGVDSLPES